MDQLFEKIHPVLPLFKIDHRPQNIIYTPGYVVMMDDGQVERFKHLYGTVDNVQSRETEHEFSFMVEKARRALNNWNIRKYSPFSPECLTIHVGSECNLNCTYCYAGNKITGNERLTGFPGPEMIMAVLEEILRLKDKNDIPLNVVFHGSGEPTFFWEEIIETCNRIKDFAQRENTGLFIYLATNGCLNDKQIEWLAKNISLIGISCDGPEEIQNNQRTGKTGFNRPIAEVCRKITEHGGNFNIRVTITKNTITRQLEIARYMIHECFTKNIRVEPVYLSEKEGFSEDDADAFYENFKLAQYYAESKGGSWTYSGVRIDELHGTYCDSLRNNLRLTPDGFSRNCFCFMNDDPDFITGEYDLSTGIFSLSDSINILKIKNSMIPEECQSCINIFHCSRGCPDFCINDHASLPKTLNPFRCRLHQLITVNSLKY